MNQIYTAKFVQDLSKLSPSHHKIVMAFERFQHSGFNRARFTKELYRALSLYCGFIAHYDLDGFYNSRFRGAENVQNTYVRLLLRSYAHEETRLLVHELQQSAALNKNLWEKRSRDEAEEEIGKLRARVKKVEGIFG